MFPNLKFATYPSLLSKEGQEIINQDYDFIVFDELHRTGAKEWGDRLNTLIDNQPETTKVLGITATPRRDTDGINMANEMAERLGYTNKEAVSGKHIAMNMSLTNAIRMGLVVNPKLVSCAYSLKTDGSLDKLKDKIEQIEDLEEKNEKLAQYETLRRNVENAEGIPEILQSNVKKGGKYIVFLPIVDELEDEDGNVIGRKKGKDKLADYEKQIAEYFKGSDITPNFHSMLGEYGDKENAKRLEEFQNSNTEETEFMLVMNKANEGLHLDKLDGMIWLRPMDENSRILYLQQLGRVIYSEDPDNPTKDEDRPVVIDLVNNTIKVNWEDEITEQDDIQMLNLITNWVDGHNGILPNINSTDKEETGYARILKEIQDKYKGYLENEFDGLNEKQIEEVKEIIKLGTQIDLWQIELPEKIQQTRNGETNERSLTDRNVGPFEVTGLLKDFIDIENEVNEIEKATSVEKFIDTVKRMKSIGVDVSELETADKIETLAKKSGINRKQLEETGLDLTQKIGRKKNDIAQAYRGNGECKPPTREQVEELKKLGISLEKTDTIQEFIDILNQLKTIGVDVSKVTQSDTIETLAKKSGVDRKELEEIDLNPTQRIGLKKNAIAQAYRGKGNTKPPTKEQVEELKKLGISLEKIEKVNVQEFIDIVKQLKSIGVDVSKINPKDTIETLAKKSGIDRKELEEVGLNPTQKIGQRKTNLSSAYRGNGNGKPPTEEQVEELKKLGIGLKKIETDTIQEFIDILNQLKIIGVDVSKIGSNDTIETLAKKSEINRKKLEEIGLEPTQKIGQKKTNLLKAYRGQGRGKLPTNEQVQELKKLGISLEKIEKNNVQEFIDTLKRMKTIGVDVSKVTQSDTIETLAKKSEIDRKKLEEIGLNPTRKIGKNKDSIALAYRGKGTHKPPTNEQVQELKQLGVSLEKIEVDTIQEFIDILNQLKTIGVDVSKITQSDTIETLAKKSGMGRKELEEIGLNPTQRIGRKKNRIAIAYRGKSKLKPPTKEQVEELKELGISLEYKLRTGKEIAEASISSLTDIEMSDREDIALKDLVKKRKKEKEGGTQIDEQS